MSAVPTTASRRLLATLGAASLLALAGCSMMPSFLGGGPDKPRVADLEPNPGLLAVRQAWTARIGQVAFPLSVSVAGDQLAVAGSDGTIALLEAASGRELWRTSAGAPITAGAGTDGTVVAVITRDNDLVAASQGKVLWRQKLSAQGYTAPFVAGNRVFVLAGDRSVSAFDGQSGRRLWSQPRPGEPLVLRQSGVLLAVGDTLLAGQGGRLVAMNPTNGSIRWDAAIATPRGTNDVERLVDLVGRASRVGNSVCVRAFQAAVGCVDATRGGVAWTKPANGGEGLGGDERLVVGTETDGRLVAWRRDNGERAWTTDKLLHRGAGTPLLVGNSVAVGDAGGQVHVLSREDGKLLTRLATDGSAIAAAPVVAGNTLVVVTRNGAIYGFVPQ